MARRKGSSDDPALKPVPTEILDQFVDDGLLTAQDIEAAMRRFKKADELSEVTWTVDTARTRGFKLRRFLPISRPVVAVANSVSAVRT